MGGAVSLGSHTRVAKLWFVLPCAWLRVRRSTLTRSPLSLSSLPQAQLGRERNSRCRALSARRRCLVGAGG